MADSTLDIPFRTAEKALQVLELALHPNTGDKETLAAINAWRRLVSGITLKVICENVYGGDGEDLSIIDEWEELWANQQTEMKRLRAELRRANKALDALRRRKARPPPSVDIVVPIVVKDVPDLVLTDEEWAAIINVVPAKHRNDRGRERVAAITTIVRTKCGWRVLDPLGTQWTTYYN